MKRLHRRKLIHLRPGYAYANMQRMDIKETRKALGLTQAELGFKLGITGATVSRLESGEIEPSVRDILAIEALVARIEKERAA